MSRVGGIPGRRAAGHEKKRDRPGRIQPFGPVNPSLRCVTRETRARILHLGDDSHACFIVSPTPESRKPAKFAVNQPAVAKMAIGYPPVRNDLGTN